MWSSSVESPDGTSRSASNGPTIAAVAVPLTHGDTGRNALLWAAAAFGLATGWLDLVLVLATRTLDPRITMTTLRTNQHFVWMVPLSNVMVFGALGLVLAILDRFMPRATRRVAWHVFAGLAALSLLLTTERAHPLACLALASGVGGSCGALIGRFASRLSRVFRVSNFGLGGLLVVTTIGWVTFQAQSERWRLTALRTPAAHASNVLWIVLDTVRADSMSLYGCSRPTTPNLDRLAAQGVRFSQARSTAPWTLASHASMFTGRWCHELSVSWDRGLDCTMPTIAEYLEGRGYATAGFVGNAYYCNARYGLDRGFARYEDFCENRSASLYEVIRSSGVGRSLLTLLGYKISLADWGTVRRKTAATINDDALAWIDGRPAGRPFFVFLNYNDAHAPYLIPEGSAPRFGLAALSHAETARIYERFTRRVVGNPRADDGPGERVLREGTDLCQDSYESCIAYLDQQIARLFAELERRGLRDNTIIIITSDHGEHFREHGFQGHGLSLYRNELHVPLVIFPPGSDPVARRVVDVPVSLRDLSATVADVVGGNEPAPFPGRSLASLWNAASPAQGDGHRLVLSDVERHKKFPPNPRIPATLTSLRELVFDGRVYIQSGNGREELYDLANDPDERHDLSRSAAELRALARCRKMLERIVAGGDGSATAGSLAAQRTDMAVTVE